MNSNLERRLGWLLIGRLALAAMSGAIALGWGSLGRALPAAARQGLGWTLIFAVLATAASAIQFRRGQHSRRLAVLQLGIDVALVSALVLFTGGRESVFSFLYVVLTVYGALLFERRGALGAAMLCAVSYGALLLAVNGGWLIGSGEREAVALSSLVALWGVHVGALFLVAALASVFSGDLHRTGAALLESSSDLRRLRNLYRRTVESIMSGLLTTDPEGRVTSFNPEAERITGAVSAAVIGGDVEAVIPGVGALLAGAAEPGAGAAARRTRMRYQNRGGEDLFLGLAGSILRDEAGTSAGHVLIFQDVTNVVQMEEALRRRERMAAVGEMSAKMAHEIRNPLAAISGAIQVLRRSAGNLPHAGENAKLMDIAVRETERLDELISDFLNFARPRPLRTIQVDVSRLIDDFLEMFRPSCPDGIELCTEITGGLFAQLDPAQLRQLLWNLCINAVQAMPEAGRMGVEVRCRRGMPPQGAPAASRNGTRGADLRPSSVDAEAAHWLEIIVWDTGEGIAPETLERMFEPFFTTKREGSGLGLAVVHRVVESHAGLLRVEVRDEGPGTRFCVWLPRAEAAS